MVLFYVYDNIFGIDTNVLVLAQKQIKNERKFLQSKYFS